MVDAPFAPEIAACARSCLLAAPLDPPYRDALAAVLAVPGGILSDAAEARWGRLVRTCADVCGGDAARAVPFAAASELFMAALDLLDDAEDGEAHPAHPLIGAAQGLNASTGLLLLAQQMLLRAPDGPAAAEVLLAAGVRACSGQHDDLATAPAPGGSLDRALAVSAGKSPSLVAAICRLGALAAGADDRAQERYARFGWHLGLVKQLVNDVAAFHPRVSGKADGERGQPTLPLAYAAAMGTPVGVDARADLWSGGPACFTWAIAQVYRARALTLMDELTDDPACRRRLVALLPVL